MASKLTHWLFSFGLHTCNVGDAERVGTDPFTGASVSFPIDDGLTDDEIENLHDTFDEYGIDGPEPDGEGYAVYGSDGERLRFRCDDLDGGEPITDIAAELTVKRLSDEMLLIILNVARTGNLALTSTVGDNVRIVDRAPGEDLLARWPDAESVSSAAELRAWLEDTIGGRQVCSLF